MEIGKVRETKGDRVVFVTTGEGNPVSYGQIVRIHRGAGEKSKLFYSRITDAGSRSTLEEVHELQDLKGSMRTVGPYSKYRYVESVLFLEKDGEGRVRAPTLNPEYGWVVETLDEADYGTLELSGEIKLGYLRAGPSARCRTVGINVESIPRMMAIVGQIGSGKTNAELVLNSALLMTEGRAVGLVFDFAGELLSGKEIGKGLGDTSLSAELLEYYSVDRSTHNTGNHVPRGPIRIGLRKLQPQHLWLLFPEFSYPQEHYASKLHRKLNSESWIADAVLKYEEEDVKGVADVATGQKNVINALLRKLSSLDRRVFSDTDYDFTSSVINALTSGKSVLVDVSGLREDAQKQIVTWVTGRVVNYYKEMWRNGYEDWRRLPYLLITIEEAHKFLAEKETFFSDIALTFRKYKVGLNAVTPRPSGINRDIFAELWTKIILKTNLKDDRTYLAENTPYLEYSDVELKMLDVGEALLVSQPKIHFAVPVQVFDYKEYLEEFLEKYAAKQKNIAHSMPAKMIKRSEVEENVV